MTFTWSTQVPPRTRTLGAAYRSRSDKSPSGVNCSASWCGTRRSFRFSLFSSERRKKNNKSKGARTAMGKTARLTLFEITRGSNVFISRSETNSNVFYLNKDILNCDSATSFVEYKCECVFAIFYIETSDFGFRLWRGGIMRNLFQDVIGIFFITWPCKALHYI